jgi:hypothetical protein
MFDIPCSIPVLSKVEGFIWGSIKKPPWHRQGLRLA